METIHLLCLVKELELSKQTKSRVLSNRLWKELVKSRKHDKAEKEMVKEEAPKTTAARKSCA